MKKRMGIAAGTVGPSDDSREDPSAGVRCKGADEVADEVVGFVGVVVRLHFVKPNQQLVDVFRRAEQEISSPFGDDEVLRENLQGLFVVFQRPTAVIVCVAQPMKRLPRHPDFSWAEMRDGHIAHVVADRPVSENWKLMSRPKNPFLNGLGCLVATVQLLGALDLSGETVNSQTDSSVFNHLVHPNRLDLASAIGV